MGVVPAKTSVSRVLEFGPKKCIKNCPPLGVLNSCQGCYVDNEISTSDRMLVVCVLLKPVAQTLLFE